MYYALFNIFRVNAPGLFLLVINQSLYANKRGPDADGGNNYEVYDVWKQYWKSSTVDKRPHLSSYKLIHGMLFKHEVKCNLFFKSDFNINKMNC